LKRFLIMERAKNFSSNTINVNEDSRIRAKKIVRLPRGMEPSFNPAPVGRLMKREISGRPQWQSVHHGFTLEIFAKVLGLSLTVQ
jgi:hypothetical protein